ncbi:hypothetical protein [Methylocystis sp.]|uniref:hypothetical protein n=1 Tax=Methylocystis sp. TaxID=1911079 RepID=UPI003D0B3D85
MNGNSQNIDFDELDHINDRVYALHLAILAVKQDLNDLRAGPALIQLSMDVSDQLDEIIHPSSARGAREARS